MGSMAPPSCAPLGLPARDAEEIAHAPGLVREVQAHGPADLGKHGERVHKTLFDAMLRHKTLLETISSTEDTA